MSNHQTSKTYPSNLNLQPDEQSAPSSRMTAFITTRGKASTPMTQTRYRLKTINKAQAHALTWLNQNYAAGFQPEWFITAHFHFPADPQGRIDTDANRRTDLDRACAHARLVSNALQRGFWSNREGSRLDRKRNPIPTLFTVERDAQQHHLHIMIPPPLNVPNTQEAIEQAWRDKVIPACTSLSRFPIGLDVRQIWDLDGLSEYFVKQTTDHFHAIDYQASTLPFHPPTTTCPLRAAASLYWSRAQPLSTVPWPPLEVQHYKAGRNWSHASY
jgi:hypothetical protein